MLLCGWSKIRYWTKALMPCSWEGKGSRGLAESNDSLPPRLCDLQATCLVPGSSRDAMFNLRAWDFTCRPTLSEHAR